MQLHVELCSVISVDVLIDFVYFLFFNSHPLKCASRQIFLDARPTSH